MTTSNPKVTIMPRPPPPPPPSPSSSTTKPLKSTTTSGGGLCNHAASATLDLLILILVLFSATFLLTSYFSYLFHSFSLLFSHHSSFPYLFAFLSFSFVSFLLLDFFCGRRSRCCRNPRCKGLKKALEFDLQLLTVDSVKSAGSFEEIDGLPWKGGTESNPDYECLRAELRKMAPPNGRAVLLFRAPCGCPVAKLEGWSPKKGRRHKKALANVAVKLKGRGDHC